MLDLLVINNNSWTLICCTAVVTAASTVDTFTTIIGKQTQKQHGFVVLESCRSYFNLTTLNLFLKGDDEMDRIGFIILQKYMKTQLIIVFLSN